jgi:D-3-phosphoglycerate dehydrogenase
MAPARTVLSQIGAAIVEYDCDTEEKLIAVGHRADALLIHLARTPVTRRVIERLAACKIITRAGIGTDRVDLEAAAEHHIIVTNLPDYCVDEVAAHAVALVLDCARKLTRLDRQIRAGKYDYMAAVPAHRLAGSTVGLVGFGRIGRSAARKLSGFDVMLVVSDPFVPAQAITEAGGEPADLASLLRCSDYVCLFLPLTSATHHLIGRAQLALMKPTAYLINTSRGPIVDEEALIAALRGNKIAGAGIDVYKQEPIPFPHPLLELPNVVVTPHIASATKDGMWKMGVVVAEEMLAALRGDKPRFIANPQVWERGTRVKHK